MKTRMSVFILQAGRLRRVLLVFLAVLVVHFISGSCFSGPFEQSSSQAGNRVVSYPAVSTAVKSSSYTVSVNGVSVFTEQYKDIHYVHFAFTGMADIVVTAGSDIKSYTLSPESYGIQSKVEGRRLSFTIAEPGKLVVRMNNGQRLCLFADPIENDPSKLGDSKLVNIMAFGLDNTGETLETERIQKAVDSIEKGGVLYLPPGIYSTGTLRLKSNMTLYLAAGAMLKGATKAESYPSDSIGRRLLMIADATDVTIKGRGIIDGNGAAVRASGEKAHLLTLKNSSDILIEGIFLRESASWNTHILCCDRVTIRNIKMINDVALSNTDGFDPDSSSDVLIEDSFIYAGDDAVAVKTSNRGKLLRDLVNNTFRNNVVMTQKSALKVGTETRGGRMTKISFLNNQVIQSDRGMAIYCNDGADISDVQFIGNHFEGNYPDSKRRMIDFKITNRDGAGLIRNILIKNCSFSKPFPRKSTIEGLDAGHTIQGVVFQNFSIAGKMCRNAKEAQLETGAFVEDITFTTTR